MVKRISVLFHLVFLVLSVPLYSQTITHEQGLDFFYKAQDARDPETKLEYLHKAASAQVKPALHAYFHFMDKHKVGPSIEVDRIEPFLEASESGDREILHIVGMMYINGLGVRHSPEKAEQYLSLAAEAGSEDAGWVLGNIYMNRARYDLAYPWIKRRADKGERDGINNLAFMYFHGHAGILMDKPRAIRMYREASDKGWIPSQMFLARLYIEGEHVPQDISRAIRLYEKVAVYREGIPGKPLLEDHIVAMRNLGKIYYNGQYVPQDLDKSRHWLERAAYFGDPESVSLCRQYFPKGDGSNIHAEESVEWLRKAVARGDVESMAELGIRCLTGKGVTKNMAEGVEWSRKAASGGSAMGQNNMGNIYEYGMGVEKDLDRALYWYRMAAVQGFVSAQTAVGVFYLTGKGTAKDVKQAQHYLEKAADEGDAKALEILNKYIYKKQ